jgi:hypothetical protein
MRDGCDHEAILNAFRARASAKRERAIRDAYLDAHADVLLSTMLDEARDVVFDKVVIAAHLGDLTGAAGVAALRRAVRVTGPGTRDLRCAALLALAKRIDVLATPDLVAGLATSDGTVKDYAVVGLAGAGDGGAWDEVFDHLRKVLRRKRRTGGQSDVDYALCYLSRHVFDASRRADLVTFIRRNWDAIDEDEWFARLWPDAAPGGPSPDVVPVPDAEAIRAWARRSLFEPLGVPDLT